MSDVETGTIETDVPARLDRLPWARFHWLVVVGLGTVWILDGLEVTIVGSIASRLTEDGSGISISAGQIGTAAAIYVTGACIGALFFGQLTDRLGRKKLFVLTLAVYITATVATAFAFAPWYFYICRFFTGAGIGGEYAAINSAIDELIPARVRGRVDLMINGSYWLGAAGGSALAIVLLNTSIFAIDFGWRLAFGIGAILGLTIMLVRRHVPESPRWLFIHGREEEAERIVDDIEQEISEETDQQLSDPDTSIKVRQRKAIPFREIAKVAFELYPKRAILGLSLFVGQAFMYNALTFDLGTILGTFFGVASGTVPVFLVVYGLSNFMGPLSLGRLFDTVGRKPMISGCYLTSAALTVVLGLLLLGDGLSKWGFMAFIIGIFFFASSGASAAYLTVSEIFPMETRALAIAFFYAIGTAVGGITGPLLFGNLIDSGERSLVAIGFFVGAVFMAAGGVAELLFGVKSEQASLEDIAQPLTVEDAEADDETGGDGEDEGDDEASAERREALRRRAEAEEERARAAEHRAAIHELRARPGSDREQRAQAESVLADIADLNAQRADELAAAHEARDEAEGDDDAEAAARAHAAEQRATSLAERAEALSAEHDADADLHAALAEAARHRARAAEQRALAEAAARAAREEDGPAAEAARARADMHGHRADVEDAHAAVASASAEGGDRDTPLARARARGARPRRRGAHTRGAAPSGRHGGGRRGRGCRAHHPRTGAGGPGEGPPRPPAGARALGPAPVPAGAGRAAARAGHGRDAREHAGGRRRARPRDRQHRPRPRRAGSARAARARPSRRRPLLGAGPLPRGAARGRRGGPRRAFVAFHLRQPAGRLRLRPPAQAQNGLSSSATAAGWSVRDWASASTRCASAAESPRSIVTRAAKRAAARSKRGSRTSASTTSSRRASSSASRPSSRAATSMTLTLRVSSARRKRACGDP